MIICEKGDVVLCQLVVVAGMLMRPPLISFSNVLLLCRFGIG